ncbi:hypothetical protein BV20DRAFT_840688 [Pilatotrama ljubarskyi]|nr:hypothetical protein BV20DRAFT_840688 [Pilatotrama ljubarskyi]
MLWEISPTAPPPNESAGPSVDPVGSRSCSCSGPFCHVFDPDPGQAEVRPFPDHRSDPSSTRPRPFGQGLTRAPLLLAILLRSAVTHTLRLRWYMSIRSMARCHHL